MGHKFAELAFTESVKAIQREKRSRDNYAKMEQGEDFNYLISPIEAEFISERDSFYMASVSETDWPYVQHRGGPAGFMKVLDAQTIGFADFSGNRQYVSTGNFNHNNRVSLFFMDYPNRRRLKLLGRVTVIGQDQPELLNQLKLDNYRAKIERGFIIHVEAFDWNCPQHITPRYSETEVEQLLQQGLANANKQQTSAASFGDGPLALTITGIRQLTPQIRAYELRSTNGEDLPAVTAGSHLQLPIRLADGSQTHRHYSICSNPARRDIYEVAVLHKAEGSGGSTAIHQHYELGTVLHCQPPLNYFDTQLDEQQPVILIAGGVGITPIKAIAQALIETDRPVHLHYAGRSLSDMAFADRLQRALGERISLYPADQQKRLNVEHILSTAAANTVVFACGPEKLLHQLSELTQSLKFSPQQLRLERFSNSRHDDDQAISLNIVNTGQVIEVAADQSVLDALLAAGIEANYSCKTGICKQCVLQVVEGDVDHRDGVLSPQEQATQFCPCVSRAKSEQLSISL